MSDLPILFSAPMVHAILREIERPGTGKTQTRRVLTAGCDEPPTFVCDGVITAYDENGRPYRWPNTKAVGDRLYVREAWRTYIALDEVPPRELSKTVVLSYLADPDDGTCQGKHRPAMFMPRWASRITLTVTDVRVQRLQEISEADAIAEGADVCRLPGIDGGIMVHTDNPGVTVSPGRWYRQLWDSLNDSRGYGWDTNPWVAAYTFSPVLGNIDQVRP